MTAHIILLNGIGSAGKSSIAKALQASLRDVYLHVAMDAFFDMLPAACIGRADGIVFEPISQEDPPVIAIHSGPAARRCMQGMRHAVAALAAAGNNILLDEVPIGSEWLEYEALLSLFIVHKVAVVAPLEVLEARERARGDRLIGLARWQWTRVHQGMSYDHTVDTARHSAGECADAIARRFGLDLA